MPCPRVLLIVPDPNTPKESKHVKTHGENDVAAAYEKEAQAKERKKQNDYLNESCLNSLFYFFWHFF
jgi:hypothetical protein